MTQDRIMAVNYGDGWRYTDKFDSTIPAEACTELGANQDDTERPMQMLAWLLIALPVAAALLVIWL